MTAPIAKTCGCCGRTFTPAQWAALPSLPPCEGWPEMKNCPACHSTLAIEEAEQ